MGGVMSKVPSVGIIGGGFVGSAIASGFAQYADVKIFDRNPERSTASHSDAINQDVIFLCVPTPMKVESGEVDTSIVNSALNRLNDESGGKLKTVVIKSTIPGEQMYEFWREFVNIELFLNPEFLTERTALLDFQQSNRHIFGTSIDLLEVKDDCDSFDKIEKLFKFRFPQVPIHWVDFHQASLIKYFTNVFFATKVSLINEFAQVCKAFDLDPAEVIGRVMLDARIGRSHFQTPGHDGKMGFGGHCFPKDLNGYLKIARDAGVDPKVGAAAWEKNIEVRPEKDWEQDKGRAVSDD
jgi:UDPglucose 6-dehydrogenase